MEHSPGPNTKTHINDQSGGVASRPTERLRSLIGRLRGLLGRNAHDVWRNGPNTQRGNKSVWPTSSKERMNQWGSTPNQLKQTGEQRDSSSRITRTFTNWLGADYDQDLSPRYSCWPQRMKNLTVWKSFSTVPPIQKSSQTAKPPNSSSHINSKSSQENHLHKAARYTASDHPYPSWPNHCSPTSQSQTRMLNALLHLGSHQSSMILGSQKDNVYAALHPNI